MNDAYLEDDTGIRLGSGGDGATLTFGEAVVAIDGSGVESLALRAYHLSANATAELELWGGAQPSSSPTSRTSPRTGAGGPAQRMV